MIELFGPFTIGGTNEKVLTKIKTMITSEDIDSKKWIVICMLLLLSAPLVSAEHLAIADSSIQITGSVVTKVASLSITITPQIVEPGETATLEIVGDRYSNKVLFYNNEDELVGTISLNCPGTKCSDSKTLSFVVLDDLVGVTHIKLFSYTDLQYLEAQFRVVTEKGLVPPLKEEKLPEKLPPEEVPRPYTELSRESIQGIAIINQQVPWTTLIALDKSTDKFKEILPRDASDIGVYNIILGSLGIKTNDFTVTDKDTGKELTVNANVQNIGIEYKTPAPYTEELSFGQYKKQIAVKSPSIQYENILTFTQIPEIAKDISAIRVYKVDDQGKESVEISSVDINNNGLIDQVQWMATTTDTLYETDIIFGGAASYGSISANLVSPTDNFEIQSGEAFEINVTATCEGQDESECGNVYALARYNGTSLTPNTPLSTIKGDIPFYIIGGQELGPTTVIATGISELGITKLDSDSIALSYVESVGTKGSFEVYDIYGNEERGQTTFFTQNADDTSITSVGDDLVAILYEDAGSAQNRAYYVVFNTTTGTKKITDTNFDNGIADTSMTKVTDNIFAFAYTDLSTGLFVSRNVMGSQQGPFTFSTNSIFDTSIIALDSNSVAIAYNEISGSTRATFVVYNLGGTQELAPRQVTGGSSSFGPISITSVSNGNKVAIAYKDTTTGGQGKFTVYNAITGAEELAPLIFANNAANTGEVMGISIAAIDSDSVAIAYRDTGDSSKGKFVVYNVDGTLELSATTIANNVREIEIIAIDSDSVAIAYRDNSDGNKPKYVIYSTIPVQNPLVSTPLLNGQQFNFTWLVNATAPTNTLWKIGALLNSSFGTTNVPDSHTTNSTVCIGSCPILNIPYTILNAPENASAFPHNTPEVTLNFTALDQNNDLIDVFLYGVNSTSTNNFYENGLLYSTNSIPNGTTINYNWSAPVVIPDANTVILYHLDNNSNYGEDGSVAHDFSGKGNDGIHSAEYVSGKFDKGLFFRDGSSDLLLTPYNSSFSGDVFSACAWVRPDFTDSETLLGTIMYKMGTYQFGGQNVGWKIYFEDPDGGAEIFNLFFGIKTSMTGFSSLPITTKLTPSTLYHICATTKILNEGQADARIKSELFVNGQSVGTGLGPKLGGIQTSDGSLFFGSNPTGSEEMEGLIDEIAIWNRTLNSTEIQDLYRLKTGKYFWKVNVTDSTGLNNESETREFTIEGIPNQPPVIESIEIKDLGGPIPLDVTPRPGQRADVNITVQISDPEGLCQGILVTSYICNTTDASNCADTSYTKDYTSALVTQDTGTSCIFNNLGFEDQNTPWFFEASGQININPWTIFITASDVEAAINGSQNFTYNAIEEINYSSMVFLGASSGQTVNVNEWNTNIQDLYRVTNFGNIPLFIQWNITNPVCDDPLDSAPCDHNLDIWDLAVNGNDDFMIDDDTQDIIVDPADLGTAAATFLSDTPVFFPDLSRPLVTCTDQSCSNINSFFDTYYHIKPPQLPFGTYSTTITWTLIPSNNPPYTILNTPENESVFTMGVFNTTLNFTVLDRDNSTIDVLLYGASETDANNIYNHLLYKQEAVSSGSNISYNFTSLPIDRNSNNLAGLWHFDKRIELGEVGNIVIDSSGNSNNGILNGSVYNVTDGGSKFGYGVEFDGINDYIRINQSTTLSLGGRNATILAWATSHRDEDKWYTIFEYSRGTAGAYGLWRGNQSLNPNGITDKFHCRFGSSGSIIASIQEFKKDTWYQIVCTINAHTKEYKIYINGQLENSVIIPSSAWSSNLGDLNIGSNEFEEEFFNGTIDEIAIWNRTLNSTEIQDLYRLKTGKYFWKVNVTDSTGLNNESETREFTIS